MDQKLREQNENGEATDFPIMSVIFTRKNAFYGLLLLTLLFSIYHPWKYIRHRPKNVRLNIEEYHHESGGKYRFVWDKPPEPFYVDVYDGTRDYYERDYERLIITGVLLALAFIVYGYTKKTNPHSSPDNRPHVRNPIPQMSEKVVNCEDCGGIVSLRAESCPHCGAPVGIPES
tara:strand:+ start:220 stop:741 length:522 start_codon:yes stop_codon:yes gene_type:complete